ncbi:pirin family protein [Bacillus sp. 165]|uniref:pirin family protein n=1 Tax=Bacillus sp. 165 TaxID=1529117 RepID=UPI001ADA9A22|nr:pirin family protein [Bacillus sp. 165]MBO9128444.1 pirin family protein [Bacillus sp. 165]
MIQVFPGAARYMANHGWLQSRFSFSFAEYYDVNNVMFGPLRVFNEDTLASGRGFAMHPHQDMEIVSIVLEGHLKHEDSYGNSAVTTVGQVQRMSAGTGIFHSETNASSTERVCFLQMWFLPEEHGLTPSYQQTSYTIADMKNNLLPIVSKYFSEEVAYIHQDMTIYMAEIEPNTCITFTTNFDRKTFLFVIEGDVSINETFNLQRRDSARIIEEETLVLSSFKGTRFILIDLP